jgi:hypothetical protein
MTTLKILKEVQIASFIDNRGKLDVAEFQNLGKFEIRRIYYISNVPESDSRGAHAHKSLDQVFFALMGKYNLTVTNGSITETVELKAHSKGYFLPAGCWRELNNFSSDAICLVLASKQYEEDDYIYSFEDFLKWRKNESN